MALLLEPLDVWVFRDGRPFSAGEDHHARCVFPPSPFTVQGALRSKILTERCGNLDKFAGGRAETECRVCGTEPACRFAGEVGTPRSPGAFRLRYVLPARRGDGSCSTYLPLPRHVVRIKAAGDERPKWMMLTPRLGEEITGLPSGLRPLVAAGDEPVDHPGGWVDTGTLTQLLAGRTAALVEPEPIPTRGESGMLLEEPRGGIGLDRARKTAARGQLFVVDALRLHDGWGLVVGYDGLPSLPPRGLLDIGGEGRAATFVTVPEVEWPRPPVAADVAREGRFLVYVATPALLRGAAEVWTWRPGFIGPDLVGTLPGSETRVRLVAAAIGSPQRISGWELGEGGRGGRPRPMRSAVPAGSAYFFEIVDGSTEAVIRLHGRSLSAWGAELTEFGFGLAFVGRW